MEKSISVYLFVIYLIVLSEEAKSQLLGQRTPHLLWLTVQCSQMHLSAVHICVFSVACVVPYNLLQSLTLYKIL
jgi:hypothetical protein